MPFSGFVDPGQLKLLTSILDEYCAANFILDERERRKAGRLIVSLFRGGMETPQALRAALNITSGRERPILPKGGPGLGQPEAKTNAV